MTNFGQGLRSSTSLSRLLQVFNQLGLLVARENPHHALHSWFSSWDTPRMEVYLPPAKLGELQDLLWWWLGEKLCWRSVLECLVGKLAHVSTVVRPGKIFWTAGISTQRFLPHTTRQVLPIWPALVADFLGGMEWHYCLEEPWGLFLPLFTMQVWAMIRPASQQWFQFGWQQQEGREPKASVNDSITLKKLSQLWWYVWYGKQMERVKCGGSLWQAGAVALMNLGYSHISHTMHLLRCLFLTLWYCSLSSMCLGCGTHLPTQSLMTTALIFFHRFQEHWVRSMSSPTPCYTSFISSNQARHHKPGNNCSGALCTCPSIINTEDVPSVTTYWVELSSE